MKHYVQAVLIVVGVLILIPVAMLFGPMIISLAGVGIELIFVFLPAVIAVVAVFVIAHYLRKREEG